MKTILTILALAVMLVPVAAPVEAKTTKRPKFGCYEVTAASLNIRKKPYSSSNVIGVTKKGDILIKRHRWCALRGFWCPITTEDGIKGYVDKKYIKKEPCPARLAKETG